MFIVTESYPDLILAVRVLEALSQAPIPEAGLRRMNASQEHPPIERVPTSCQPATSVHGFVLDFFVLVLLLSAAVLVIDRWSDGIIPVWSTRLLSGTMRLRFEKYSCTRAVRL